MNTPARSNRFTTALLVASFALLSLVSGCSGSFAQPSDFPRFRDSTPPVRERLAAHEHRTTAQPSSPRGFDIVERSRAAPRAGASGRRVDF